MRRLALLCLVAAVSGYNLVLQEFQLTGSPVANFKCDDMANLHVGGATQLLYDCYDTLVSPATDPPTVAMRHIVYQDKPLTTKAKSLDCEIVLGDASTLKFTIKPQMKAGQTQKETVSTPQYTPITTTAAPTAPPTTSMSLPDFCKIEANRASEQCVQYCKDKPDDKDACPPAPTGAPLKTVVIKAARKTVLKPKPEAPKAPEESPEAPFVSAFGAASIDNSLPLPIRVRGPGPVRRPVHHPIIEDTVVSDEEEVRRVKRDDPPPQIDVPLKVVAVYYILDEAGNPAAVWAAVIEGIILLLLIGACFYFFFWAPRARQVAAAASDPYKDDGPSYSVSYANSSYNNQRIDAFQPASSTATPAAPPRPANSTYMDDYITDNIGAMSRPGATPAQPASAAANSSAFQPGHQRFDSSGLVTVNLS